jgi:hypothetical protein
MAAKHSSGGVLTVAALQILVGICLLGIYEAFKVCSFVRRLLIIPDSLNRHLEARPGESTPVALERRRLCETFLNAARLVLVSFNILTKQFFVQDMGSV